MSSPPGRRGRLPRRQRKLPGPGDWERADRLTTRAAPRRPELISDGGGMPFPPAALDRPPQPLDPQDPAVAALLAHLTGAPAPKSAPRAPWRRQDQPAPPLPAAAPPGTLDGWRLLARSDSEALFGRGEPPALATVAVLYDARRKLWSHFATSAARPLRATRDGIRASSWRLDPTKEPSPEDTVVHLLVTEQTFSGGQRASGRVLEPDLHSDADQIVLTLFVKPRPGYQAGSNNPETPVIVELPEPVGLRRLIDGALVSFGARDRPADPS
jgi:hypothetical protein